MTSTGSVEGRERLRLFCALRLPEDTLERLVRWQAEHVRDGGRIVGREHLHITLAFLGWTPASRLDEVADALRAAAAGAGELVFTTLRYRETRSVGMVVLQDETGEGGRLAERLFDGVERLGVYERERRPWLPHVTVLRFRSPPRLDPPVPDLGAFRPSDAAVYMSALRPSGAQYEVLESVPLGG
ncbi:MAG TPA: RNA 2',3'-cyclic phosphodiesterase [Gaiellaceae bacterium]|nr:RNA 2',3'-cyclic phosphodiesterase [Gaiellaceae bacterium]